MLLNFDCLHAIRSFSRFPTYFLRLIYMKKSIYHRSIPAGLMKYFIHISSIYMRAITDLKLKKRWPWDSCDAQFNIIDLVRYGYLKFFQYGIFKRNKYLDPQKVFMNSFTGAHYPIAKFCQDQRFINSMDFAVDYTIEGGHLYILKSLHANGYRSLQPLTIAAKYGYIDICEFLLFNEHPVPLNYFALIQALQSSHLNIFDLLLECYEYPINKKDIIQYIYDSIYFTLYPPNVVEYIKLIANQP